MATASIDHRLALVDAEFELRAVQTAKLNDGLLPHQKPPADDWGSWMIMGGRGSGKTHGGAAETVRHLREFKSDAWVMIVAPTIPDVKKTCLEGPSGLWTLFRSEFTKYNKTDRVLIHKSGGRVVAYGAESPDRLRGPQSSLLWVDEPAVIGDESIDNALFGNRLVNAQVLYTTTPRNRKLIRDLIADPDVYITTATTNDNPYLAQRAKDRLKAKYGGTRLGRQELLGQLVKEVEGALWKSAWIEESRVQPHQVPDMVRIVVAIDPATTSKSTSAETGLCVVGKGVDGDYYIFRDIGLRVTPGGWARKAIDLYDEYNADYFIGETNNGGEMVEATIREEWLRRNRDKRSLPFKSVHASRGKQVRADPISLLYEKGAVHHVGDHPVLEDQLCSFPVEIELLDRLDAMVWGVTDLMERKRKKLLLGRIGGGMVSN